MNLNRFIINVNNISNPKDRSIYLSNRINIRMKEIEDNYKKDKYDETKKIKNELKDLDSTKLIKKLKILNKSQLKLIMIFNNLYDEGTLNECSGKSHNY